MTRTASQTSCTWAASRAYDDNTRKRPPTFWTVWHTRLPDAVRIAARLHVDCQSWMRTLHSVRLCGFRPYVWFPVPALASLHKMCLEYKERGFEAAVIDL